MTSCDRDLSWRAQGEIIDSERCLSLQLNVILWIMRDCWNTWNRTKARHTSFWTSFHDRNDQRQSLHMRYHGYKMICIYMYRLYRSSMRSFLDTSWEDGFKSSLAFEFQLKFIYLLSAWRCTDTLLFRQSRNGCLVCSRLWLTALEPDGQTHQSLFEPNQRG